VIRFVAALLANTLRSLLLPLLILRRRRAAPRGAWVWLRIDGPVVELGRKRRRFTPGSPPLSLHSLRRALSLAQADERVAGLLVSVDSMEAGTATAESLREVLHSFKKSGKPLCVYLPRGGSAKTFYIASVADKLFLGTESIAEPSGYAATTPYFSGLLDQVGIEREVIARGRYKTMAEPAVRPDMSDAQREQVGAYLDTLDENLVAALVKGRGMEEGQVRALIDEALLTADEARARGLCDAVLHPDEVAKTLEPNAKDGAVLTELMSYAARRQIRFRPFFKQPFVAVLPLQGPIVERSPSPLIRSADERSFVECCRELWADDRVRGVVLAVNTGGGGALASERIRRALTRLAEKKPVVAYLANIAASGGYLAAVAAPTIVARKTTLTGSIGVIAARLTPGPLLSRLQVSVQVEKRGARADMHSGARLLDAGERERFDAYVDASYDAFLSAVAEGRGMEKAAVHEVAQGRVWSGKDALARGLVDKIGGMQLALDVVREKIGEGADRFEPQVVAVGNAGSPLLALLGRSARALLAPGLGSALSPAADVLLPALAGERTLAVAAWTPSDAHAVIDV
jgi:protease-4